MGFAISGRFSRLILSILSLLSFASSAHPQEAPKAAKPPPPTVIGIVTSGQTGTYLRIATDMAQVLDNPTTGLRILPISGDGSIQNITDLLYLKGIDLAVVQSDVLAYIKDRRIHGGVSERVSYITRLYNEELHLVARDKITSVADLNGRRVNVGPEGSGTYLTSTMVFKALGIDVAPQTFDTETALAKLKSGEIDAMAVVAGKPASVFQSIPPKSGLKLLAIDLSGPLTETYLPSSFTAKDYPGLVGRGKVETIAVGSVMAVFNWKVGTERYERIRRFVDAFFGSFDAFAQPPRQAKWQEINLAAEIPGWNRYHPAQEWLERNPQRAAQSPQDTEKLLSAFKAFLAASGDAQTLSAADQEELFKRFLEWRAAGAQ
jgi:TRAP transporter TAXI family solute receptor